MPAPTRDRLSRPVDISTLLPNARRTVNLIVDEPGLRSMGLSWSPTRSSSPSNTPFTFQARGGATTTGSGRVGSGRGRINYGIVVGQENIPPRIGRRGRGSVRFQNRNSVLPSWYPRTPLRDITAVVRAIERRRPVQTEGDRAQVTEEQTHTAGNSAPAEHNVSFKTPAPSNAKKPKPSLPGQMGKVLAQILDEDSGPENVTPERKLMNSIEKVRDAWMEEQRKKQNAPAAKRAEREKKVRTLMSMR